MKKFLISIDTEGDNLWQWKPGTKITIDNADYLYRFQNLCGEFGYKPTYLTNYEMATGKQFINFVHSYSEKELEIGMHLHAWNTPPDYGFSSLNQIKGAPYLIEYPEEIMDKKIDNMTDTISKIFGKKPVTHRSGRWAMNATYFCLLEKHGYKYDCSVTPHINWCNCPGMSLGSKGSDYSSNSETPYFEGGILEIPMSVRVSHNIFVNKKTPRSVARGLYRAINGQPIWLRPNGKNIQEMLWLVDRIKDDDACDYIMFMLHSSEFMPNGSPTFRTEEEIDRLYEDLRILFKYSSNFFEGLTIGEYGLLFKNKHEDEVK